MSRQQHCVGAGVAWGEVVCRPGVVGSPALTAEVTSCCVVSDLFGSGLVVASVVGACGALVVVVAGGASVSVGCELVAVEAGAAYLHGVSPVWWGLWISCG
jgi:hypothetical protein